MGPSICANVVARANDLTVFQQPSESIDAKFMIDLTSLHPVRIILLLLMTIVCVYVCILTNNTLKITQNTYITTLMLITIVTSVSKNMNTPKVIHSDINSNQLWNIALQSPDQAIKKLIQIPESKPENLRIGVKLGFEYHGDAYLSVIINDQYKGNLKHAGIAKSDKYRDIDFSVLEIILKNQYNNIDCLEVIIFQPIPDQKLRLAVWGGTAGASFGVNSAWFGVNREWSPGVPEPRFGRMVAGFPILWVEDAG